MVESLLWNKPPPLGGVTSLDLAGFLGMSWLSDTQVDMMLDVLQEWLNTSKHHKADVIESTIFSQEMTSIVNGVKQPASKYLSMLTNHIKKLIQQPSGF